MQITDFKTGSDQRGVSRDSDVALCLDKLAFDGRPPLPQVQDFVLLTREEHNEFKQSYSEETKRGYSMFPLTPVLAFWNSRRDSPSPLISLFDRHYIHLSCTEVDTLCNWVLHTREAYVS